MNTFMLLVICGAWRLLSGKREIEAGLLIGLGAAIKVAPGFFILYFLWKQRWQAAIAAGGAIALSLVISLFFFGWTVHGSFLREAGEMSYGSSTWSQLNQHYHVEPHNQAPSAAWYRLLTHNESTKGIIDSPTLAKGFSYITALLILGILFWGIRRGPSPCTIWEYSLWSVGMLLLPSLMWDHYLTQMFLLIGFTIRLLLDSGRGGMLIPSIAISLLSIPYWYDNPSYKQGWMTLLMNVKLYGLLLLVLYLFMNREKDECEAPLD